jgi:Gnt-I system high-affinity gluconate transporter
MHAALDSESQALRRLRTWLTRRRFFQLDLRLRLELAVLGLMLGGFVFWQVRIPLDGIRLAAGTTGVLAALGFGCAALALVTWVLVGARHWHRLRVGLQPLILGWLIATVIRIALESATIAGLTAAGIMVPIVAASHVNPNLMVLSIGAGSLMCSHVNDAAFWLFKEYFNLDLQDTFRSWTVMESLAGVVGLLCVLGLNLVLPI